MKQLLLVLSLSILFQSCKIADLRTAAIDENTPNREEKAILLIDKVIATYNLQKLRDADTYSCKASDNWKGLMAIVNPLPKDNELMELRLRPNSFDGQFNYLKTKKKTIHGVQSFKYYKIKENGDIIRKKKRSIVFTLPAIQYFFELPLRLKNAPILKYAGTTTFENNDYDLVFATWQQLKPHKEHDQYLLYINQKTGHLDFANYTVRGMYLPTPKNIYGSIRYTNLKANEDSVVYPGTMFVQLNQLKKEKRTLHTLHFSDLKLNSFDVSLLYPIKNLEFIGDAKSK